MTEIASIDWFGRWGTSFFSENTAILLSFFLGGGCGAGRGAGGQQDRTSQAGITQR